jgi:DNA-binding Lrp family transcriptional regulator
MKLFDEQVKRIVRALIRDPRLSDNAISNRTGVPVRTVGRKRKGLEEQGFLRYFAALNLHGNGNGPLAARHLYIVKFRLGMTVERIVKQLHREPEVATAFTELILESHVAEIDGHLALLLFIEGRDDNAIVESFQAKIVPALMRNHGDDCIEEVQTVRVLTPIRIFHNYLPALNMQGGKLRADWPDEGIFVG